MTTHTITTAPLNDQDLHEIANDLMDLAYADTTQMDHLLTLARLAEDLAYTAFEATL